MSKNKKSKVGNLPDKTRGKGQQVHSSSATARSASKTVPTLESPTVPSISPESLPVGWKERVLRLLKEWSVFAIIAGGLTLIQVEEYAAAAVLFAIAAFRLWSGTMCTTHRAVKCVFIIMALLIGFVWTDRVRGDQQWSHLLPKRDNMGLWLTVTDENSTAGQNTLFISGLLNNSGTQQATGTSLSLSYRRFFQGFEASPLWEGFDMEERPPLPISIEAGKSIPFRLAARYDPAHAYAAALAERKTASDGQKKLAVALMTETVDSHGRSHRFTYMFLRTDIGPNGIRGMYHGPESVNILQDGGFEAHPIVEKESDSR